MSNSKHIPRQAPNTSSQQSTGQSLFNQLLEVGRNLLDADPELYKTAVAHLRDSVPREPSPAHRPPGSELKGSKKSDHPRRSTGTFHKYNLPGDAGKKEYYQCMNCGERRVTNSFQADHVHEGKKLSVRWYCPLCDTLYAVTHRGYHIKNRHKSPANKRKSRGSKKEKHSSEEEYEKEPKEEEEEEEEQTSPPPSKKGNHVDDDNTSQGSEDASATVLASFVQPATLTPAASSSVIPAASNSSDQPQPPTDTPNRITHTVTQEALLGTAPLPSEFFRMESGTGLITVPSKLESSTSLLPTQSEKLIFGAVSATLS